MQSTRQPSVLKVFPSSQLSSASTTPSPQRGRVHEVRHTLDVVSELVGPSSHCSTPSHTWPSPQAAGTQPLRHASLSTSLPSSHSSTPCSTMPSPQRATLQVVGQASVSTSLPSSHSSMPVASTPSPHNAMAARSMSKAVIMLPLRAEGLRCCRRPQTCGSSSVQLLEQPSQASRFPSSQCSLGSSLPLPQVDRSMLRTVAEPASLCGVPAAA